MSAVTEPAEPQQVIVQDDLDQLLDMLPADLGGLLINHPKRAQLIEVRHAPCFNPVVNTMRSELPAKLLAHVSLLRKHQCQDSTESLLCQSAFCAVRALQDLSSVHTKQPFDSGEAVCCLRWCILCAPAGCVGSGQAPRGTLPGSAC